MQINYDSISLPQRALIAPLPNTYVPAKAARKAEPSNLDLVAARRQALGGHYWENMAWFAVAISALALLVISLWS